MFGGFILKKNMFKVFTDKLLSFPLWIKQIIYLYLEKDLANSLSDDFIKKNEKEIFHLHIPVLSFIGKTELSERKSGLDDNIYNFLNNANANLNILEISMNNFWTMEEVAKYYIFCLEQNYIKTPDSLYVHAMAGFMAGKFRIGEYFKRAERISMQQLEHAINKQKESLKTDKPLKMAEVLISLGYVTEKDTASLLIIKEEASKRFILDTALVPDNFLQDLNQTKKDKEEIAKLMEQNRVLKEQLGRILAFVKKNG